MGDYAGDAEGYEFGQVEVVTKTDKAILVRAKDNDTIEEGEQVWVPLEQIHEDSEIFEDSNEGEEGFFMTSMWLAKERGWED